MMHHFLLSRKEEITIDIAVLYALVHVYITEMLPIITTHLIDSTYTPVVELLVYSSAGLLIFASGAYQLLCGVFGHVRAGSISHQIGKEL